jgi:hypothetical protein
VTDIQEALYRLVPAPARSPAWDAVLREAKPRRRSLALQLAVATGVMATVALFVVAPWQGSERVGILDRALAAAGDGPVLHVVFRGEWGGVVVDLDTGARKRVYGEKEVWFDPSRDLVHQISRFGGRVEREETFERNNGDRELTALWRDYRHALERGTARVIGEDTVDGVPVYWIIVHAQMLPDAADGKDHEFAQQVAVSRETFKPVAMKYTRDRQEPPDGIARILRFETVSVEEADFAGPAEPSVEGPYREGRTPIELDQADDVLGRAPVWLGDRHAGLPLVQIAKLEVAIGSRKKRVLHGEAATLAKNCLDALRARARKGVPARRPEECGVAKRVGSLESCGDDVCTRGPVEWGTAQDGVVLFYGTLGDSPPVYGTQSEPRGNTSHVSITQTTDPELVVRGVPMAYRPPDGSVLVMSRRFGYLVVGGIYVTITAGNEEAVLAAARALEPMRE